MQEGKRDLRLNPLNGVTSIPLIYLATFKSQNARSSHAGRQAELISHSHFIQRRVEGKAELGLVSSQLINQPKIMSRWMKTLRQNICWIV